MDLKLREDLFGYKDIFCPSNETDRTFLLSLQDSILYHQSKNDFYRKFLNYNNFKISDIKNINDIVNIPVIHAFLFKTRDVFTIKRKNCILTRTSSGTTGQKSIMMFDKKTLFSNYQIITNLVNYFNLYDSEKVNYILLSPEYDKESVLGSTNSVNTLIKLAPCNHIFCAILKKNNFDILGTIRALKAFSKENLPVRILGFPQFLNEVLEKMDEISEQPIKLHPHSMVLSGGGWKNYDDKRIDKFEFYKKINLKLGIPLERCRDIYSSAEHPLPYIECKNHHFHEPIYSRIIIRDVKTLRPLEHGKPGFINFISPYLLSAPANSIIMPDLAVKYPAEKCSCGIKTPFFDILGRSGINKSRSCAISILEILERIKNVYN